jgi:hypothetical protein
VSWFPLAVPEPVRADPELPAALVGVRVYLDVRDSGLARQTGLPPSLVDLAGRVEAARWTADDAMEVRLKLVGPGWGSPAGPLTADLLDRQLARLTLLVGQTTRYRQRVLRVLVQPVQTPADRTDG